MTDLLQLAFAEAAKLPTAEQELLATRLLAELSDDDEFDHPEQHGEGEDTDRQPGRRLPPLLEALHRRSV